MRGPITWRNVNAPDFSGGNLISSGVSDIQSGLEGLQNILGAQARQQQETWQRTKEANTLNALNQVNQLRSVEQLEATQAADLINPYGAQVNAQAVMDALKGQRGVIANEMQTEDSINSYTEKVKYGPIASQAALLIQQGRTQEAAPLLQQLQGTSYAEKLGGMVQNLDWHNQEIGLKERELGLQAARIAAENRRYTEAENEDRINNQAAAHLRTLIDKGTPPNDALNQTLRVFGPKLGTDIGKLVPTLTGYASAAFNPTTSTQLAIKDVTALGDSVRASGKALATTQLENIAQKLNYNPVMQQEIDNYSTEKNGFAIGDEDGQMSKEDVDDANKTLAAQNLPPLSAGEIAWLAQNPNTLAGYTTSYKLDSIIAQRVANKGYKEQSSDIQKALTAWDTELVKGLQDKTDLATRYDLAPNAHPGAGNSIEEEKVVLNNQLKALEDRIGKITTGPEREKQKEEEIKALREQQQVLLNHQKKVNEQNEALQANTVTREKIIDRQIERRKEEKAEEEFVTSYNPKTNEEWDTVKGALGADIQQNDPNPIMKLRALNDAVERAKNGNDKAFKVFFKDRLEKYATTLYRSQKAGKK